MTSQRETDLFYMRRALELARQSYDEDEVPVGAVVVQDGKIIGEAGNRSVSVHDPCGHAEIRAIRNSAKTINNYRLNDTTLYITLEPCAMCAGAILHARVKRVVFSIFDERSGAAGSQLNLLESPFMNHQCQLETGVLSDESRMMMKKFFKDKRKSG